MTGRTTQTFAPPVVEAYSWLEGKDFSQRVLINVSQAAPLAPPPAPLRSHMAKVIEEEDTHLYGEVLGLPTLREELARHSSAMYHGRVTAAQVAITSGCNQAFSAVVATLCRDGDQIILPTPFYFNHKMWLDMAGVLTVALPCSGKMIPDPALAASLITKRTRAIALVTPNNPCGVEYPPNVVMAFYQLARKHRIALIIDETYRDFHSALGMPHNLFQQNGWDETVVHLYSFSKAYRLTGHRVGAIVTSEKRLGEVEKFLDTVSICPNQLGQKAALWGMQNLSEWLKGERLEILRRKQAIIDGFEVLSDKGWQLLGVGAYFAYVQHPFSLASNELCEKLVDDLAILTIPGTMFFPEGYETGKRQLRIAFANKDWNSR